MKGSSQSFSQRKKEKFFKRNLDLEQNSVQWLAENYRKMRGLRNFTWKKLMDGIILEHKRFIRSNRSYHRMNDHNINLLWVTFFKVAGIQDSDLKKVPVCDEPEHPHVKTIIFVYSLESFLFSEINRSSREKDVGAVDTLGPFAVAISNIIENLEA